MASPTFTEDSGSETNIATLAIPATVTVNDLLLRVMAIDSAVTISDTTDSTGDAWSISTGAADAGATPSTVYKVAHGDEDGGTVPIDHNGGPETWVDVLMQLPAADWESATAIVLSSWNEVPDSTAPQPPGVTPTWTAGEPTLFVTVMMMSTAQTGDPSPPSGYLLGGYIENSGECMVGLAYKEGVEAGTETPGTWGLDTESLGTKMQTIAIELASAGGGATTRKLIGGGLIDNSLVGGGLVHRSMTKLGEWTRRKSGLLIPKDSRLIVPVGIQLQGA